MSDRLTKEKRSALMSRIRSKNTGLENKFHRLLKKIVKKKFKKNAKHIRGTPDFVFEKERICVFIDGDFWHGWQYPRWKKHLKNNFWRSKIENNRRRDKKITRYLRRKGWKVVRFWAHDLEDRPEKIVRILKANVA